jgi:hypothetical protein
MTRCAVLVLFAAACGGGGPKAVTPPTGGSAGPTEVGDQIPATAGPDCAVVADRLATVAYADAPDRQDDARDKSRTRCADDKWADDARSCFATVDSDDELHGCATKLTAAQQRKLSEAFPDLAPAGSGTVPEATTTSGGSKGNTPDKTIKGTRSPARDSSDPCEGGEHK